MPPIEPTIACRTFEHPPDPAERTDGSSLWRLMRCGSEDDVGWGSNRPLWMPHHGTRYPEVSRYQSRESYGIVEAMSEVPEFLLIDDNADNRFLLAKTLIRKFPNALVQECQDSEPALVAVRRASLTAAIVHRAGDVDGFSLIEMLRKARPTLPILYVSGADRRSKAFEVGATAFLDYDAWLRVGAVVEDMLRTGMSSPPFATDAQPV